MTLVIEGSQGRLLSAEWFRLGLGEGHAKYLSCGSERFLGE